MIKQAILKPDFVSKMGRMDYFKVHLALFGLVLAGGLVGGLMISLLEGSIMASLFSAVFGITFFIAMFWMLYVSVSVTVKRFRDMGMSETSTLVIATVGLFIANSVLPLVGLIPLFWPPADKEVAEAV